VVSLLRFPHQNAVCISLLSCLCHMPCLSYSPWFDKPKNVCWAVQTLKLLMQFFQPPPTSSLLGQNIFVTLFLNIFRQFSFCNVREQWSRPYTTCKNNYIRFNLCFQIANRKRKIPLLVAGSLWNLSALNCFMHALKLWKLLLYPQNSYFRGIKPSYVYMFLREALNKKVGQ